MKVDPFEEALRRSGEAVGHGSTNPDETRDEAAFTASLRARLLAEFGSSTEGRELHQPAPHVSRDADVVHHVEVTALSADRVPSISRRRRRVTAGAAILAAASIMAALRLNWTDNDRPSRVGELQQIAPVTDSTIRTTTQPAESTVGESLEGPPPAIASGQPYIWLSSNDIPLAGGAIAAFVINQSTSALEYGVIGDLDRWNGSAWENFGRWTSSLGFWGGFGETHSASEEVGVRAIGLTAPAGSIGPPEFVRLPALEPGWYQLRHDTAAGIFQVSAEASALPPIDGQNSAVGVLIATPDLLPPTGGRIAVTVSPPTSSTVTTGESVDTFAAQVAPGVRVERRAADGWEQVGEFDLEPKPGSGPADLQFTLPSMPVGMYRLVRSHPSGDLIREFWVADELLALATSVSPPIPS